MGYSLPESTQNQLRYWLDQLYECENPGRAHCILAMCHILSHPDENDCPLTELVVYSPANLETFEADKEDQYYGTPLYPG